MADYITPGASLAKIEEFLRSEALPKIDNQLRFEPSPLLQKIKTTNLKSPKIEVRTGVGMNGGFGFGAETKEIPEAGGQLYNKFTIEPKTMFATLEITHKAVTLGTGDDSIHLLLDEMTGVKNSANWNIGRSLYGNSTGVLANISAASKSGGKCTLTLDSLKNVRHGLTVDIYSGTYGNSPTFKARGRVINVDRVDKKIIVDATYDGTVSSGFITIQGSLDKELTGFGTFFDDEMDTIYGVEKAGNNWLTPRVYDAENAITDNILFSAVKESGEWANSDIDMILAGDTAYMGLWNYLRETSTTITQNNSFKGGVAAIDVNVGGRLVTVAREGHLADDEMLGVDTKQLEFRRSPIDFIRVNDSGIFERIDNSSTYQAVLGFYGDLLVRNPGGLFKIINATYDENNG